MRKNRFAVRSNDDSMKIAIQVEGHPASSLAANSAYQFIKAALISDHEVIMVFFYYDGVYAALSHGSGAGLDIPSAADWEALAREHPLDLVLCSAALDRRGLLSAASKLDPPGAGSTLSHGFRIGGLGQWVEACLRCDRHITFPA